MNVTIYAGNVGDRNERGTRGAASLGQQIGSELGTQPTVVGTPAPLVDGSWRIQLAAATPNLRLLSTKVGEQLRVKDRGILTMGRCAAAIATLPLIARQFPDAAIVWFDAHGDCNVPVEGPAGETSYLGGMILSGTAGEWDTGLGSGLDLTNLILVGARDLDPPEQVRVDLGELKLVPVGPELGERLKHAIDGRQVYIHVDCDVLDAGLIATEYQSPGGLSFADLREAFEALAKYDVLGLEIAEFEDRWPDGRMNLADELIEAIRPVLNQLKLLGGQSTAEQY